MVRVPWGVLAACLSGRVSSKHSPLTRPCVSRDARARVSARLLSLWLPFKVENVRAQLVSSFSEVPLWWDCCCSLFGHPSFPQENPLPTCWRLTEESWEQAFVDTARAGVGVGSGSSSRGVRLCLAAPVGRAGFLYALLASTLQEREARSSSSSLGLRRPGSTSDLEEKENRYRRAPAPVWDPQPHPLRSSSLC